MLTVTTATPAIGYGNNLDFFRQSACVGVREYYDSYPALTQHLNGPVDDLIRDGRRVRGQCMRASDNLFVWAASRFTPIGGHLPLRAVGTLKAVTALALILMAMAQPVSPAWRATFALTFFLGLGDLAILSYFNTLYVDASALIFGTVSAVMVVAAAVARRAPGWPGCIGFAASLLWLGTVKPQEMLLAPVLGVMAAGVMWRQWRAPARATLIATAALAAPLLLQAMNHGSAAAPSIVGYMYRTNRADTVLGAVLPAARDPAAALAVLGLPPSCAAVIGKTGYDKSVGDGTACPALDAVTPARVLMLFLHQPATFLTPLNRAIGAGRPAYLDSLGHFELASDAANPWYRLLRISSLSNGLLALPAGLYTALVWSLMLAGPVCTGLAAWVLIARRRNGLLARAAPFSVAGMLAFYAIGSSVFGDGYVEIARHQALLVPAMGLALAAVARELFNLRKQVVFF